MSLESPIGEDEFSVYRYELFFDSEFRNVRLEDFSWGRMWRRQNQAREGFWLGSTSKNASAIKGPGGVSFSGDMAGRISKAQAAIELLEELKCVESVLRSSIRLQPNFSEPS